MKNIIHFRITKAVESKLSDFGDVKTHVLVKIFDFKILLILL